MNTLTRWIASGLIFLLAVWMVWFFSDIVFYILVAAVLSFMGHPLVRFFDKLHIGKFKLPHGLSAAFALMIEMIILLALVAIFIPLIARQASIISDIDGNMVAEAIREPLLWLEGLLKEYGLMEASDSLETYIANELMGVFGAIDFTQVLNYTLSFTGTVFIGLFAVVFITFFFLKEHNLFNNGILLLTPLKYQKEMQNILRNTRRLLTRYFIGICIEILSMMTLITLFLTILGVKNALLIGFFGGLMNVIPYLGPVIGAILGIIIGITTNLSLGIYTDLLTLSAQIAGSFVVANLIDNMVLQPLIYSNSVKAHPLEIFLVIMIAASLAGIPGMILAIPSYTVLRIVAKEFLSGLRVVQKLTERI